ncbi:DNA methyltransferase [Mammaliicoccus sciuri]|uniref:DNA methyltransferase n=1 Tax=Mammaliicoccus sciuri TaxID=1296 RepID=UPI003CF97052
MRTKINDELNRIFKTFGDKYFIDDKLNKAKVIVNLENYDEELLESFFQSELIKSNFTVDISGNTIIQINKLIAVFEADEYWQDSYTKYSKKIGLTVNGKFLDESTDVVLDFPYKDTVLKASMSREDTDKDDLRVDEPFLNEVIAKEEVDVLFDKKLLVNAKRYDVDGAHDVDSFNLEENLILKGNNLLALHTLKEKYSGKVKLIYIDPPYNTKGDSFVYNDKFIHSSWLTFMMNRIEISFNLLKEDGVIFIQCDDNEQAYLSVLLSEIFGRHNHVATLPTIMNLKGNQDQFGFAGTHEYILVFAKNINELKLNDLIINDPDELEKWEEDNIGLFKKGANLKATGNNAPRNKRPNLFYPIYISKEGTISFKRNNTEDFELLPITNGEEMSWRWQKSTMQKNISDVIVVNNNGEYSLYKKQRPELGDLPTKRPKSIFYKPEYSSGNGTKQIKELFGDRAFSFAKPEELIQDIVTIATNENDLIIDFFLGSGTTASVAHKMNRQYIGIEQMDYINTVSVPRLQKVIDGEQGGISKDVNWQGGGNFVYVELMEKNRGFLKSIQNAETQADLYKVFEFMLNEAEVDFRVDLEKVKDSIHELSLLEQKRVLIKIFDKNQLYYNYSEIDDENVRDLISNNDYKFNKSFYSDGSDE